MLRFLIRVTLCFCAGCMFTTSASAACPSTSASLRSVADSAMATFGTDWSAFTAHVVTLQEEIPCVGGLIRPEDAAEIHRTFAFAAGVKKDRARMTASWQAVLTSDPGWEPSANIARAGSIYRTTFDAARELGAGDALVVTAPGLIVDGQPSTTLPTQRAAIVQVISGYAVKSWYLPGGESIPSDLDAALYGGELDLTLPPDTMKPGGQDVDLTPHPKQREVPAWPFFVGAGAAGAVALVGVVGLVGSGSDFAYAVATVADPADPTALEQGRADGLAAIERNHNRRAVAVGGSAVALGLGVIGVVVPF